jgi:hypothetical protein
MAVMVGLVLPDKPVLQANVLSVLIVGGPLAGRLMVVAAHARQEAVLMGEPVI